MAKKVPTSFMDGPIRGTPVRQKQGMILENKVVQKLKLEKKMFFTKSGLLN